MRVGFKASLRAVRPADASGVELANRRLAEFNQGVEWTMKSGQWAWDGVRANPLPVGFAVGTFLLTVVYQKAKGKSSGFQTVLTW